jgi:uncharacterized protein YndB with AHSA1/START domain
VTDSKTGTDSEATVTLIVRKTIRGTAERLFEAWTKPEQLKQWWGPEIVECTEAHVDLRVGGRYRIANRFPDGNILWISGEFIAIEEPRKLVYTWGLEPNVPSERVSVMFKSLGAETEVIVTHERIPTVEARNMHEQGWVGCLDGLSNYVTRDRNSSDVC